LGFQKSVVRAGGVLKGRGGEENAHGHGCENEVGFRGVWVG
jgi:hypothetical protein